MPGEKLGHDWTHLFPAVTAAYKICLEAEEELTRQQTSILTAAEAKALEKSWSTYVSLVICWRSAPQIPHTNTL